MGKGDNKERIVLKEERFRELRIEEKGEFEREIEEAEEFMEEEAVNEEREGWKKKGRILIWKE